MPLRRYKPEQIVTALRQIEGAVGCVATLGYGGW